MLVLPDTLNQVSAVACLDALSQALPLEAGPDVVLDAGRLTCFDSAALAVMLEMRRRVLKMGKQFAVKDVPQRLQDLAALYGIAELLPSRA